MQLIGAARSALNDDLRFAFYQDSLLVTVPSTSNRFEIELFTQVTPHDAINELAGVIGLAEQLIDGLDLETRIGLASASANRLISKPIGTTLPGLWGQWRSSVYFRVRIAVGASSSAMTT